MHISWPPIFPFLLLLSLACSSGNTDDAPATSVDGGDTSAEDAGNQVDAAMPCAGQDCTPGELTDPGEPGPSTSTVETTSVALDDSEVALTIYTPNMEGPLPVVIFTHGFQLSASQYASYGEHLASWGYIVVMPDFPGGIIGGPNHRELKVMLISLIDWVVDNASSTNGPLAGRANADAIALDLARSAHDRQPEYRAPIARTLAERLARR